MRAVEIFSVVAFLSLGIFSAGNLNAPALCYPITLLTGWLLADLFSGLVHWTLDTPATRAAGRSVPLTLRPNGVSTLSDEVPCRCPLRG